MRIVPVVRSLAPDELAETVTTDRPRQHGAPGDHRERHNGSVTAKELPSRFADAEGRIPASLDDLRGPERGVVHLPNRLCWSGPSDFDITDARQRLTLYTLLLDCGQRDDFCALVHPKLLAGDWASIRRLTSRELVGMWERRLPTLAA